MKLRYEHAKFLGNKIAIDCWVLVFVKALPKRVIPEPRVLLLGLPKLKIWWPRKNNLENKKMEELKGQKPKKNPL